MQLLIERKFVCKCTVLFARGGGGHYTPIPHFSVSFFKMFISRHPIPLFRGSFITCLIFRPQDSNPGGSNPAVSERVAPLPIIRHRLKILVYCTNAQDVFREYQMTAPISNEYMFKESCRLSGRTLKCRTNFESGFFIYAQIHYYLCRNDFDR